ncbi:unnamed protein product, partial [Linum tenue]
GEDELVEEEKDSHAGSTISLLPAQVLRIRSLSNLVDVHVSLPSKSE